LTSWSTEPRPVRGSVACCTSTRRAASRRSESGPSLFGKPEFLQLVRGETARFGTDEPRAPRIPRMPRTPACKRCMLDRPEHLRHRGRMEGDPLADILTLASARCVRKAIHLTIWVSAPSRGPDRYQLQAS
jgi:hypothetical protein